MSFYFQGLSFKTLETVYEPQEDSSLLAANLDVRAGDLVLDMGTGTGIQGIVASKRAKEVLSVDINPAALKLAKENAALNNAKNITFRKSDLFSRIKDTERFDLIAFNPPYLPGSGDDMLARSWAGGRAGREVIDRFIYPAANHLREGGRVELLASSQNDMADLKKRFADSGLSFRVIAKEKLWFEELYVIVAKKMSGR